MADRDDKPDELNAAIAALNAQRSVLGDAVVDPAIAALREQLAAIGSPAAPPALTEERKIVTIVFVDISGFTALAETLDAEQVRQLMNSCFEILVPVIQKYGGTIDKFIGDEIMALFGAPIAHENDPERALRAALEMMEAITAFNQMRGTNLGLHIGINTGPVVTGGIGAQDRRDYSVMGDAVNLAARLEDASADGEIYIGPNTYRRASALFDFVALTPLELKGKSKPVQIYKLVGVKAEPKPVRGIEGLRAELVGRDREFEQMRSLFRALEGGSGGVLAVKGEAGLGKSRLIAEALHTFGSDLNWAEGRALSHTTGMSFWMARDVLRGLVGLREDAPAHVVEAALRSSVEALADGATEVYPYLARLLELPLENAVEERIKFLTTEALHRRILAAFRDYVGARAEKKPLALFWEDLHWCDPSSLRVLLQLAPIVNEVPLFLILAYRADDPALASLQEELGRLSSGKFHVIQLSSLSRPQSSRLVESLLKIENLPVKMRDLVVERAEGNPFYVEELLRALLDSGALAKQNGTITVTAEISQVTVPETLHGVLTARIDQLPQRNKQILQTAAVIGRVFHHRVLSCVCGEGGKGNAGLSNSLDQLQRREFIQRRGEASEAEYIFKHAITQDVAYNTLLLSRRKEIHRAVASALETIFADRLTELAATVGYHFEKADAPEKALHYLYRAGQHAQETFANTEAIAFYRSAIAQAEALLSRQPGNNAAKEHLARIQEALGDVLKLAGQTEEARSAFMRALSFVAKTNGATRSRLHRKFGLTHTLQRRYAEMSSAFAAAEDDLGESGAEPTAEWWYEKIQLELERMHLFYWQGMSGEMVALAERDRADFEARGTPLQRGRFFTMLSLSQLTGADYVASDECVRLGELAVATCDESEDLSEAAHIRFTGGLVNLFHGNLDRAIEHFKGACSSAERVGDLIVQARCLTYLAVAHRRRQDRVETRRYAERTIELATRLRMVEYVAMAKANLAWLRWREGHLEAGKVLATESLKLWHGMDDPYGVDWLALLPLIAIAAANNDNLAAVEYAKGLFTENQHALPESLRCAAQELIATGEAKEASGLSSRVTRVVEAATEIGYL